MVKIVNSQLIFFFEVKEVLTGKGISRSEIKKNRLSQTSSFLSDIFYPKIKTLSELTDYVKRNL